jgi:hypothetical protein
MVDGVKTFLFSFHKLDPNPPFISKELGVGGNHLPAIKSVSDPHFPKEYINFEQYFQCTNAWAVGSEPIIEKQLQAWLDRQRNWTSPRTEQRKKIVTC